MYRKILVPMALDHGVSPQTLKVASTLRAEGGEVIAFHVHEAVQSTVRAYLDENTIREGFEHARRELENRVSGVEGISTEIVTGHSARSIIDYANENGIDCIVIGSHKPGLSDYFLGSTAARVVRHATCAVHVHRSS